MLKIFYFRMLVLAKINVNGIVQGVGFRPFVYRIACELNLKGYVQNLGDAGVEIVVEGRKEEIKKFLKALEEKKPPLAEIKEIKVKWMRGRKFSKFEIKKSREKGKEGISIIPPDVAICNECIEDMKKGRRKNYFFTTCTNCGPRFTIIKRLPYDRHNTTMEKFEMCEDCRKEYKNPANRRYHAQTIACLNCGPKIFLSQKQKIICEGEEAIWKAAQLLNEEKILAIKGIGGYHIACITRCAKKLRKMLNREQKPFALMVKDIKKAKEIAYVSKEEEKLLSSYIKPIILLKKRKEIPDVAPGLHNYGIMLPYTGLHYMLFKKINEPLIMTSANMPGKPIIKDDEEIKEMGIEYILFYNREIYHRCDDSIAKFIGNKPVLIRRSRGYVPNAIELKFNAKNIIGFGAEENVTICFLRRKFAFISQHIGDLKHYETFEFFEQTLHHFKNLLKFKAEAIACDLHPNFITTKYAEEEKLPLFRIQHHHAHVAKAMGEHGIEEAIGIAIDGIGYGEDGNMWGGEILHCWMEGYERIGHLQEHPMIGGDLATKYPLRMVAGILKEDVAEFLHDRRDAFPHGEKEIEIVLKEANKDGIKTSSCGRCLDAVASLLDICHVMSYDGEPAMKLESIAKKGKNILEIEPVIKNNVINTKHLFEELLENINERKEDLAYSAEHYIANSLAELAVEKAIEKGIKDIVIAGGCAYNEHIVKVIEKKALQNCLNFYINKKVPCGDGGISFGQALIANAKL